MSPSNRMAQLTFEWPLRPSFAEEDFIVSGANREAVGFLESWPGASSSSALLSGPQASGKTHLARNWATRMGARFIDRTLLGKVESQALWQGGRHAVLEDIDSVTDETALFHLLRHAETQKLFLLLTARENAAGLHFTLPDLTSRVRALPGVVIGAPDEDLLRIFLFKHFSDRQIRVSDEVIEYGLKRMERSFKAACSLAEKLERHALESGRQLTVPRIKSLLG